ncbi:MAG: hypothetical protein JWR12_3122 [Mucilaginibacter sp.]|jgi:phosphopantetheinyl transferase (holo-ACP synthase)|nr:hypothetical protein [Mucilaginibacter sp.]
MISTGNDIVALKSVNKSRTNDYKFYSKILAAAEQALHCQPEISDIPFENYVWLLWSVKEAAYKYLKRTDPSLLFSPTKIIVTHIKIPLNRFVFKFEDVELEGSPGDEGFYSGNVQYGSKPIYFRSIITSEWISTVVNEHKNFGNVHWGIRAIDNAGYEHQSKAVREFVLSKLNPIYNHNLQIAKSPVGYPVILKDELDICIPVSMAHDGNFVAYSFISPSTSNN